MESTWIINTGQANGDNTKKYARDRPFLSITLKIVINSTDKRCVRINLYCDHHN